jgi:eukaryotic-like serine/threonine-protein kinase
MEYLPDGSVADRYKGDPVPAGDAVRIMEEACRGVEHLHARGLLHRDIKPGNLLLTDTGSVKVSDFGLSCQLGATRGVPLLSYTSHLPPEAVRAGEGITSVAGDVYALGVTTYRLLNGDAALAHAGVPAGGIRPAIMAGRYPDRGHWEPHIHPALRLVVRRALHTDPAKRYATSATFRHALERVRPAVSWWPVATATGHLWQGVGPDSSTWSASIQPRPRGGHRFAIERRLPGKAWRQQKSDSLDAPDEPGAVKHAEQVLGRIAHNGR